MNIYEVVNSDDWNSVFLTTIRSNRPTWKFKSWKNQVHSNSNFWKKLADKRYTTIDGEQVELQILLFKDLTTIVNKFASEYEYPDSDTLSTSSSSKSWKFNASEFMDQSPDTENLYYFNIIILKTKILISVGKEIINLDEYQDDYDDVLTMLKAFNDHIQNMVAKFINFDLDFNLFTRNKFSKYSDPTITALSVIKIIDNIERLLQLRHKREIMRNVDAYNAELRFIKNNADSEFSKVFDK